MGGENERAPGRRRGGQGRAHLRRIRVAFGSLVDSGPHTVCGDAASKCSAPYRSNQISAVFRFHFFSVFHEQCD